MWCSGLGVLLRVRFSERIPAKIPPWCVSMVPQAMFRKNLSKSAMSDIRRSRAVQHRVQRAAGRRADAAAQKKMCRSQEQFLSLSSFLFTRSKEQFLSLSSILCTRSQEHDTFHGVCVCGKSIGLCCLAVLRLAPTTFIKPVLQGWGEVKYKRVGMGRDFVII